MSFGIPVRNGLSIGLLASTFLTSGSARLIPGLTLNFLTGAPLDSRITFTRSTTATFVGSNGLIQTAAINAPRFGYGSTTLLPKGLLVEENRTNFIEYSERPDLSPWVTFAAVSFTTAAAVAPDGNTTAVYAQNTGTVISLFLQSVLTSTCGTGTQTCTVFAKANTANQFTLNPFFQLDPEYNATFTLTGAGSTDEPSFSKIEAFSNGWYRCSVTYPARTGAGTGFDFRIWPNGRGNTAATGCFFWGFQQEAGAFATSYIPTAAATVARTADIAVMTGTNFSSWYNASEGTFVSSFEASPNTFTTYVAASNGVVAQNSMHMNNDGSGNMRAAYYSGSSAVALLSLGAVGTLGAVNTLATTYKVNDFAASRNGGAVVTDTLGAVPAGVTQLNIGADPSGAAVNVSNTHIRSITYYRSRLTNAQLQTLSA